MTSVYPSTPLSRHNSIVDHVLSGLAFIGLTIPVFWVGLVLQLVFAVHLGWLPSANMTKGQGWVDDAKHMILPVIVLAIGTVSGWSRYVRITGNAGSVPTTG